jgi:hypothetical protein
VCSLVFGTDFQDDGRNAPRATASKLSWPALLAKQQHREYHCYARPGAGNLQILDTLLSQIDNSDTLYVIGWTYTDRRDYRENNRWAKLLPHENSQLARTYFAELQDNYTDQLTALTYMQTAISMLGKRKYIMVCQDRSVLANTGAPGVAALLEQVRLHIHSFEGSSFVDWAHDYRYPISATKHPLEAAHAAAATYALDHFLV